MHSPELDAYLAVVRAMELVADLEPVPLQERLVPDLEAIADVLRMYALTDEERAWLDGRKDDGKAKA